MIVSLLLALVALLLFVKLTMHILDQAEQLNEQFSYLPPHEQMIHLSSIMVLVLFDLILVVFALTVMGGT